MTSYKITISRIHGIYKSNEENGAVGIKLAYDEANETLTIYIRNTDDCEPYWSWNGEYECSFKNWAILLFHIANDQLIDDYTGKPLCVICEWK